MSATLRQFQDLSAVGETEAVRVRRGPVSITYLNEGSVGATVEVYQSYSPDKSGKILLATYSADDARQIYDAVEDEEYLWFSTTAITSGTPLGRFGQ